MGTVMPDYSRYKKLDLTPQEEAKLAAFDAKVDGERDRYYKNRETILRSQRARRAKKRRENQNASS